MYLPPPSMDRVMTEGKAAIVNAPGTGGHVIAGEFYLQEYYKYSSKQAQTSYTGELLQLSIAHFLAAISGFGLTSLGLTKQAKK